MQTEWKPSLLGGKSRDLIPSTELIPFLLCCRNMYIVCEKLNLSVAALAHIYHSLCFLGWFAAAHGKRFVRGDMDMQVLFLLSAAAS